MAADGMDGRDGATLVSVKWLRDHLGAPDVRLIDATWFLPTEGRDARAEFDAAHIPGAVFFDIDAIADDASDLPHMIPPMEKFVSRIRRLGVGDGHRIIIYDAQGMFSAARVWWTFRYFGHRDVAVLDGGLPHWRAEGGLIDDMPPSPRDRHFTPRIQSMLIKDVTQVAEALKLGSAEVVDARSPTRFRGEEPEPRQGVRPGHMPGAKNVHYRSLLSESGEMAAPDDLRAQFTAARVDLAKPVITTCGSGVTAAILNLALERLGHRQHALYDGSWAEWGSGAMLPVETG